MKSSMIALTIMSMGDKLVYVFRTLVLSFTVIYPFPVPCKAPIRT